MNERVIALNDLPVRPDGEYVLYWAQMNRRVESNHALLHAVALANELNLPVLFHEGLTNTYPHANDRLHTFVLEGVPDNARRLRELGIGYAFYLRRRHTEANDILHGLAEQAAMVVTDDYPASVAREHNARVPGRLGVAAHAVDSSCVVPMNLLGKREYAAYTIRPKIHKLLAKHMIAAPPVKIRRAWTAALPGWHLDVKPEAIPRLVAECDIGHSVKPSLSFRGGSQAARKQLSAFLDTRLRRYAKDRNEPSAHATSELSPYLHFGHISALEVALAVRAQASEHKLIGGEFLEELIVRRELAFNFARHVEKPDSFDNLPDWARKTLGEHDGDARDPLYSLLDFEQAKTHDALWNATQKELLLRGKIHGYYRMYWGKKIIEWSANHREALDTMVYLHDRHALDGRDPNTYANILWCFGLHDRPWRERAVFGMVRYMSLDGMKRKTGVDAYLREIEYLERTGKDPFRLQ